MSNEKDFLEREVLNARFEEVLNRYFAALERKNIKISDFENRFVQEYQFLARIKNELWATCDPLYRKQAEFILANAESYMAELNN